MWQCAMCRRLMRSSGLYQVHRGLSDEDLVSWAWQDAAGISQTATWLTHDELRGLGEQIGELFKGYLDRLVDPAKRPPGSRPVGPSLRTG